MFLNDWLTRRNQLSPDRIAIVDQVSDRRFTYADLDARATALAARLGNVFSIGAGDRVACLAENRMEWIDLYFACGKLGAVLVPLNFRLPAEAVLELLQDCRPRLLVYGETFADHAARAEQAQVIEAAAPINEPLPEQAEPGFAITPHVAAESEVAMILYTSGTTGRPKGAMITWRQIHWNALNTVIGLALTQDDAAFLNTPLYHTGGWHVLFTPLMLLGGRLILQRGFDPEHCNACLGSERVTILFGVPTMMRMMEEAPNFAEADFSQVRFAICGGEPCPVPVIEAYQSRGVAVRQGYGLTEAGPNCFSLPAEDAVRKQGSIGFPNFHIGARLVKDDGTEASADEVGELWMKGPHVFAGYWNAPKETAAVLRDGWLATGDLMRRDADGYFYVVGRKKQMYVSGGENVYPAQVERVLQAHDAVAQAAVVAVPDARWGEIGWAFLVLHRGESVDEDKLHEWCRQRLAKFQCPGRLVVMDALPVGHSGKIDKLELAKRAAEMVGPSIE